MECNSTTPFYLSLVSLINIVKLASFFMIWASMEIHVKVAGALTLFFSVNGIDHWTLYSSCIDSAYSRDLLRFYVKNLMKIHASRLDVSKVTHTHILHRDRSLNKMEIPLPTSCRPITVFVTVPRWYVDVFLDVVYPHSRWMAWKNIRRDTQIELKYE